MEPRKTLDEEMQKSSNEEIGIWFQTKKGEKGGKYLEWVYYFYQLFV